MDFINDFILTEFGFLLIITTIVWGGFFSYLMYILFRVRKLENEVTDLKAIENES